MSKHQVIPNNASSNNKYLHYPLFQKIIQKQPLKLFTFLQNNSPDIFNSIYISKCKQEYSRNLLTQTSYSLVFSIALVYGCTILIRRKRGMALTAPSASRSVMLKYMPICLGGTGYYLNLNQVTADFGQIQNQFWNIYSRAETNKFQEFK